MLAFTPVLWLRAHQYLISGFNATSGLSTWPRHLMAFTAWWKTAPIYVNLVASVSLLIADVHPLITH